MGPGPKGEATMTLHQLRSQLGINEKCYGSDDAAPEWEGRAAAGDHGIAAAQRLNSGESIPPAERAKLEARCFKPREVYT